MQERSNWRNAESDDDDESDNPGYGSYRPERPAPPRPERPPVSVHVPLSEGVIWRQNNEDLWKGFNPEGSKDKKDDDDEDDEDDKEDSEQPVVAKKDKADAGQEADNTDGEISAEGIMDAEDEATADKDEQQDSNVFVYPEEVVPATEAAAPVAVPETSAPEHHQQPQPVAEAVPPALSDDYYEQQAAQPPAIPPELQINQPPLPPIGSPSEWAGYAQPPERPVDQYPYSPGMYPSQNIEYAPVQTAANTPAERAPVPVDNHRHGEPLAAAVGVGLGLGLLAERSGRKRGDRKQQKQSDRFAEEIRQQQENTTAQYQRTQEQQRALTAEQQRQVAEMQRMRTAQERLAAAPVAPYALENAPSTVQAPQRFESAAPRPLGPIEHQPGQQQQGSEVQHQPPKAPEQPFEPTPEGMPVKPQQHVEHSSWHNIVVDKHGREVTDAIHYGQEFHRQREHEMLQDRVSSNPTGGGGGAAGGGGIAGQQQDHPVLPAPYQHPQSTLPSGMTSPALPPGHPSHADPQHQLPSTSQKEVTSNIANPWFWLMLALVIAAFFTAALI